MSDELNEDAPLTADEILTFGPCVEAQVWTPMWLQEERAPIAVAAGRPKLGKVFDDQGVGKAVIIRPCMSRGRRIRGLPPVYTPQMLESHTQVFEGWPMFTDHVPPELAQTMAKHGRSVKELGGQVLKPYYRRDFTQESDAEFGYQRGGTLAEVWATPFIRKMVGENPNLLHTSINAWPTSGKPGPVPWRPGTKGMLIEGIRRQPQGSVDYVVRGGAGGKLLVAEGLEDEGEWPEVGEWNEDDRKFVVSLAESFYASGAMAEITLPTKPEELRDWLTENAAHLLPALQEADSEDEAQIKALMKKGKSRKQAEAIVKGSSEEMSEESLTEADVQRLIEQAQSGQPTVEEFEAQLEERTEALIEEREQQRNLSEVAHKLIESAEGIPPTWKADLKARYVMLPSGPSAALLVEAATDSDGNELSEQQVLEARVKADLDHTRDLIAEATGKPRVTGEGGAKRDPAEKRQRRAETPYWRTRFASMGLAESEDKAIEAFGGKVTGD